METQQLLIVIMIVVLVVGGRGDRGDFDGGGGRVIVKVFIVIVFARHCFVYSSCCLCLSIGNATIFWTQFRIYWNFCFGCRHNLSQFFMAVKPVSLVRDICDDT